MDVSLYIANVDFAGVMKIKDLEMGRFSWIIQVARSKAENFAQLQTDGSVRRGRLPRAGSGEGERGHRPSAGGQ